jgi:CDP-diacylglycerol pyrophosphatase
MYRKSGVKLMERDYGQNPDFRISTRDEFMTRASVRPQRVLQSFTLCSATGIALLYGCHTYNPNVLWRIVSQSCVPAAAAGNGPGECTKVSPDGYALLKDIRGNGQYLLIPTTRVEGVESEALLRPDASNYFAYAWENRGFVGKSLGKPVPDDLMSLALNSADGRSQNQYHIHIDCMSRDMRKDLSAYDSAVPGAWVDAVFNGHHYQLMRVADSNAASVNPFVLVLRRATAAHQPMRGQTIFMATAPGGFFVVDGTYQRDGMDANPGSSEELQDHSCRDVVQ